MGRAAAPRQGSKRTKFLTLLLALYVDGNLARICWKWCEFLFEALCFLDLCQIALLPPNLDCSHGPATGGRATCGSLETLCWICVFLGPLHVSFPSQTQTNDTTSQAPSSAPSPVPEQPALKPAELDALVAPIALYPDTLLSNVLMAPTYPLEVVRADRWMNQHKDLRGDALKAAAEKQDWDESVKALVATPSVLQMMNEQLEWTQKLGEAFLTQQQDVIDAVQRLRSKAYDRKKLVTTKEQKVTVKEEQNRQVIYIEPAVADSIYVPYYDPQVVYGDWPYADYPAYPYYWGYPGYIGAGIIATGLAFGAA